MAWVFLSPHFDDIALSCGGLVWELAQRQEDVSIWTICAGDPPPGGLSDFAQALHTRWQTPAQAVNQRCQEDQASCQAMCAQTRHFTIPDCIYRPGGETRTYYYASEEGIFGALHPAENELVNSLAREMEALLPGSAQVVCPLTLGGHVDHQLTRAAAEKLSQNLWYYADYPYVVHPSNPLEPFLASGWTSRSFPISEAGLSAWQSAVAAHRSQISTFWPDLDAMRRAIQDYCQSNRGVRLWKPV